MDNCSFKSFFASDSIVLIGRFVYTDLGEINTVMSKIVSKADELASNESLELCFFADYYCTWSRKRIMMCLHQLSTIKQVLNGCSVRLVWGCDSDDEDIQEFGELLSEHTKIPITFVNTDYEVYAQCKLATKNYILEAN
jgi:hypothetical protein